MPNIKREQLQCKTLQEKIVNRMLRNAIIAIFQAWRVVALATMNEALTTENARLSLGNKKAESIWSMNKEQLVETARRELGVSLTVASRDTVIVLREKIRRVRQIVEVKDDPLTELPRGLEKMKLEELKELHAERSLPQAEKMTRAAIILQIRDDVLQRSMLSQTGPSQSTKHQQETTPDSDWDMPDQKPSTRVKK